MAFNAVNKVPDVYIDEIQLPGPIAGVGTSTPAFIGPALGGVPNKPTLITSWTEFLNKFGPDVSSLPATDPLRTDPNRGYITSPPVFVTHAVRGFFDNGGAACYFVRASTAVQSSLNVPDRTGAANSFALAVRARKEGPGGNGIRIIILDDPIVPISAAVVPVRAGAALTSAQGTQALLTAAGVDIQPGDIVLIEQTLGAIKENETAIVEAVSGTTLTLRGVLSRTYANANTPTIRIADLDAPQQSIRLNKITGIEPGTTLHISQQGTTNEETVVVKAVNPTIKTVVLAKQLTMKFDMTTGAGKIDIESQEFSLTVNPPTGTAELYPRLSIDPRHSRYFRSLIEGATPASIVDVSGGGSTAGPPKNLPEANTAPGDPLAGGLADQIENLTPNNYTTAIDALEVIDDVNMLCVPDMANQAVQAAMIAHCEKMQDRFAILDPVKGAGASNGIVTQRNNLGSLRGFGALYYPRIYISDPFGGGPLLVPPSGHIAGVYARTDDTRGVHKAPANEQLRGALALETDLSLAQMGILNEQSVNVLRPVPGAGILVWGARTLAKNTQWRYVNIRRLLLFIEESIQEGTQFAVFEPNNLSLRAQVKRQVTDFLTRVWRAGGLFGATPEAAFRVRVDEELNPPDVRALGQLIIEVVVVPTSPAEFIVFRIISDPTGNVLQEQ
jgi:phage tail sheath protein FI